MGRIMRRARIDLTTIRVRIIIGSVIMIRVRAIGLIMVDHHRIARENHLRIEISQRMRLLHLERANLGRASLERVSLEEAVVDLAVSLCKPMMSDLLVVIWWIVYRIYNNDI